MDNREKILTCALNLFYRRGYDAVGIQEICETAGVTKPTLYHYFGSKLGLLSSLLETKLAGFYTELRRAAEYHGDLTQTLYDFATVVIDTANENRMAFLFLMNLCYSPRENETFSVVKPYADEIFELGVQVFEQASSHLGNMHGRQRQFATGFIGLLFQYLMMLSYETEQRTVTEDEKRGLIHQFMHGIYS
ncbi:MAG: helix-turn-helix domain-containing protein [Eubacteriales bacterium]|nr:helix-turn-helix domain-containing protein [Eubacteriales bacterium]